MLAGAHDATFNNVNQAISVNGVSFVYDANGNLLDDGVRTYKWDAENRLISIGYKAIPTQSTTFRYDGLGRRLAIVNSNGSTSSETRYLWCGDSLCQARSSSDVVTRRYYPEGEVIPQGNTQLYYGKDHLGSVRDVLAAQNGSRVAFYDYDPNGNVLAQTGRISVDFRYARTFYHPQSGLYLTNYRAYDPKTGRWLNRDPIEESGGINLYAYVGGKPTRYTDPTGLCTEDLCVGETIIAWRYLIVPIAVSLLSQCKKKSSDAVTVPPPPLPDPQREKQCRTAFLSCAASLGMAGKDSICWAALKTCLETTGPMIFPGYGAVE